MILEAVWAGYRATDMIGGHAVVAQIDPQAVVSKNKVAADIYTCTRTRQGDPLTVARYGIAAHRPGCGIVDQNAYCIASYGIAIHSYIAVSVYLDTRTAVIGNSAARNAVF